MIFLLIDKRLAVHWKKLLMIETFIMEQEKEEVGKLLVEEEEEEHGVRSTKSPFIIEQIDDQTLQQIDGKMVELSPKRKPVEEEEDQLVPSLFTPLDSSPLSLASASSLPAQKSKLVSHLQYYLLRQNEALVRKLTKQANTASSEFEAFKRWAVQDLEKHRYQLKEAGKNLLFKSPLLASGSTESRKVNGNGDTLVVIFSRDLSAGIVEEFLELFRSDHPLIDVQHSKHNYNHFSEDALYITPTEGFIETFMELDLSQESIDSYSYLKTSSLQRQTLLYEVLKKWHFLPKNPENTNYPLLSEYLADGGNVFRSLGKHSIITQVFPMHDRPKLTALKHRWIYQFYRRQPLEDVCEYFGVKIGIYFAFIGFYTKYLLWPMLFGIIVAFLPVFLQNLQNLIYDFLPESITALISYLFMDSVLFSEDTLNDTLLFAFTIFNMFWSTIMLQKWEDKCSKKVKQWVDFLPIKCSDFDVPNDDPPSEVELASKRRSDKLFKYLVTTPVIAFCLIVTFMVMFQVFHFQVWVDVELIAGQGAPRWVRFVPKVTLALIIGASNYIYSFVAIKLNDMEGYQEPETKENYLILKLVLYQFINNFLPLFYLAFYLQDIDKLKEQLAAQLITRQVVGNFNEAILPVIKELFRVASRKLGDTSGSRISKPELESCLYRYESTYDDYLELVVQYGYVMLFAPVFPLAALYAFLNNLLEIRSDAFKLCFAHQRPFAAGRCDSIGQWRNVFFALSLIAIANNCALMVATGQISRVFGFIEPSHVILTAVAIEHGLMTMKWLIPSLI